MRRAPGEKLIAQDGRVDEWVEAKRTFDIARLRAWVNANDVTVPAQGRIPQAVVDQYKQAGGWYELKM